MKNNIQFELVSPEEKLVSEPVKLAVLPGTEGEFGVGGDHTSLVASLKAGVVTLHGESANDTRRIFIAGGFADVTGAQCVVLAEEAVNVDDLDGAALESELERLNADLDITNAGAIEKARLEKKISLIEAKLQALAA